MENILDNKTAYIKNDSIRSIEQLTKEINYETETGREERCKDVFWSVYYTGDTESLTDEQREILSHNKELQGKLMSFGGQDVCMPWKEIDLEPIMERGQFWYGDASKKVGGTSRECHSNSAKLWRKHLDNPKREIHIVTGYALSDDGLWRQHSWAVEVGAKKNIILESTTPRVAYFGFVMTEEESFEFLRLN